jgi:hypothetical protein
LEKAKEEIKQTKKKKQEVENKLSKLMTELEQTKKSLDKDQRADEEQLHLQTG